MLLYNKYDLFSQPSIESAVSDNLAGLDLKQISSYNIYLIA